MRSKVMLSLLSFMILFIAGFLITGCTTIGGSSDMVLGFSQPIPVTDLIIGSFTYNTLDKYIVRPDGSLIPEPTYLQREEHEAYHKVISSSSSSRGRANTTYLLKDGYHYASDIEVYAWAHKVAAENGGITRIIAVRTLSVAIAQGFGGINVTSLNITVMVYGDPSERRSR